MSEEKIEASDVDWQKLPNGKVVPSAYNGGFGVTVEFTGRPDGILVEAHSYAEMGDSWEDTLLTWEAVEVLMAARRQATPPPPPVEVPDGYYPDV